MLRKPAPATRPMSSWLCSSRGIFSFLPLLLRGAIASALSAAFIRSAKAIAIKRKAATGVAVPSLIVVFWMILAPVPVHASCEWLAHHLPPRFMVENRNAVFR